MEFGLAGGLLDTWAHISWLHFTDHCYTLVPPVIVFINLLVTASSGGHVPSSGFQNYSRASAAATSDWFSAAELRTQLNSALNSNCSRNQVGFLYYDWQSVGQSVLVSGTHLGPMTKFVLRSDSCGFVDVGRLLWWEDGPVVYSCCSGLVRIFIDPGKGRM
jgi:hypothetical protein